MYSGRQFATKGETMPTSTFFNLPREKRVKILRSAEAEFSRKPCGEVSINRIIQAADIPRGSFYQYFSGKTDLFHYLLHCCSQGMESILLESLDACGGSLLDLPLVLFDRAAAQIREDGGELRAMLAIVRQNAGLDLGQVWDPAAMTRTVLERAELSGLALSGPEEAFTLLDLLLSSTAQAFVAICCGKLTEAESRRRLTQKTALLRRAVEHKEDHPC